MLPSFRKNKGALNTSDEKQDDLGLTNDPAGQEEKSAWSTLSEQQVWRQFRQGDAGALGYIYHQYADPLYNYGRQISPDAELVKDCIQDLFIELMHKRRNLGEAASIKHYLFASFRRKLIRQIKRSHKLLLKDKITEQQDFGIALAHDLKLIEHQMTGEQKALLNKAVKNLSARQREVILLYYYEGFSFEQISYLMEMGSVQAVRNLLGRAIHKLFEALSKHKNTFIGPLSLFILWLTHF